MAARSAILAIRIISDATKAAKGFDQAATKTQKFEKGLARATKVAAGLVTVIGVVGSKARTEASDLEQSAGAVEAVYGKQAAAIKKAAKGAADSLGLAQADYQQMSAVFGSQLQNLGVATQDLVPQTKNLIALGGDLAATFGGKTSDAVEALSSLMRGERDPIERYGVSIKQADINARLAAEGKDKLTGAAKRQAETEATLALLMDQTSKAQGQRAREAGTDAQAQEKAAAKMRNAYAKLGKYVLPITTKLMEALAAVAGWVGENSKLVVTLAAVIGGLAVAVFAVNGAYRAYQATLAAAKVAQAAFNVVMAANPIVLIVLAVIALAAALVLAYKKSETFRNIVNTGMEVAKIAIQWVIDKAQSLWSKLGSLKNKAKPVTDAIKSGFDGIKSAIQWVIDKVQALINKIKKIKFPSMPGWVKNIGGGIGNIFGSYTPPGRAMSAGGGAMYARRPAVFAAPGELKAANGGSITSRVGGSGGAGIVQINVNGALDPNAVADQIGQLLRRQGIRTGVRTV